MDTAFSDFPDHHEQHLEATAGVDRVRNVGRHEHPERGYLFRFRNVSRTMMGHMMGLYDGTNMESHSRLAALFLVVGTMVAAMLCLSVWSCGGGDEKTDPNQLGSKERLITGVTYRDWLRNIQIDAKNRVIHSTLFKYRDLPSSGQMLSQPQPEMMSPKRMTENEVADLVSLLIQSRFLELEGEFGETDDPRSYSHHFTVSFSDGTVNNIMWRSSMNSPSPPESVVKVRDHLIHISGVPHERNWRQAYNMPSTPPPTESTTTP